MYEPPNFVWLIDYKLKTVWILQLLAIFWTLHGCVFRQIPPMKNRLKRLLKVKKDHIFHEMWAIRKLVINAWLLLHPLFNGKFEKIIICVEILDLGKKRDFSTEYTLLKLSRFCETKCIDFISVCLMFLFIVNLVSLVWWKTCPYHITTNTN